jgi:hypothetical protein
MVDMLARSADTDPEAERVQIDLLRRAGPTRRVQMALTLSAQVIGLARLALRRASPGSTDAEIDLEFVARYYGPDLADDLRRYLQARRP